MKIKKNGFTPILMILTIVLLIGVFVVAVYKNRVTVPINQNTIFKLTQNYDGHYEDCVSKDSCNFLDIKTTNGQIFVSGQASWEQLNTVNVGEINGALSLNSSGGYYNKDGCIINFKFSGNQLIAKETSDSICGGLNVRFDGTYIKK